MGWITRATLGLLVWATASIACTSFEIPQSKEKIVGNSFDWHQGQALLFVNKRDQAKSAFQLAPVAPRRWTSKFGSLTYNQYGRELPLGGMNEAGVAITIMWLDSTQYPALGSAEAVNELQWIQYHLDNFATTGDVVRSAGEVRIVPVHAKVHYFVCDRTGECATIEFLGGEVTTHVACELAAPTLANDTYDDSAAYLRRFKDFGGTLAEPDPRSTASLDRFARASILARRFRAWEASADAVGYAFGILSAVGQGDYSKLNVVMDRKAMKLYFRSHDAPAIKSVSLSAFDYSCATPSRLFDMNTRTEGDVTARFAPYTRDANRALVAASLKSLASELPEGAVDKLAAYPETLRCEKP